jgi:hypothetical protein
MHGQAEMLFAMTFVRVWPTVTLSDWGDIYKQNEILVSRDRPWVGFPVFRGHSWGSFHEYATESKFHNDGDLFLTCKRVLTFFMADTSPPAIAGRLVRMLAQQKGLSGQIYEEITAKSALHFNKVDPTEDDLGKLEKIQTSLVRCKL